MIYHSQPKTQGMLVWAMMPKNVEPCSALIPKQIKFICIQPYRGFVFLDRDESFDLKKWLSNMSKEHFKECDEQAIFADTKEELISYYLEVEEKKIVSAQNEILRLKGFLS